MPILTGCLLPGLFLIMMNQRLTPRRSDRALRDEKLALLLSHLATDIEVDTVIYYERDPDQH